jgi:hypothetical protein
MKLGSLVIASTIFASAAAFTVNPGTRVSTWTQLSMFTGAGAGVPVEDDPEALLQMENTAKQMGMSLDEYKLGINARTRLTDKLDAVRLSAGDKDTVSIERDGHNPPKVLEVTITEAGKALGKDAVAKALCDALTKSSDDSKNERLDAQKDMMTFISEEMKKMGVA